jgi:hypothetical protein
MRQVLEHRTLPDVHVFLSKIDQYTTLEARDLFREGGRYRTLDLTLRPAWTFLKLYLYKQGFRDGIEGFMFCALSGLSVAVRTWKLRELDRLSSETHGPRPSHTIRPSFVKGPNCKPPWGGEGHDLDP